MHRATPRDSGFVPDPVSPSEGGWRPGEGESERVRATLAEGCFRFGDGGADPPEGLRHVERLIAMGHMVAGFAHEVRNPLAALKSLVEDLVADTPDDDPRTESLVRADRLVRRIEGLVRSSLQLGAPSAPLRRPHDPAALVDAAVEGLAPRWKRAGGVVTRPEIEPGLPRVLADEDQIVQVLSVLLNNALDAADGVAHVAVRVRRAEASAVGDAVAIDVEDGGPGIAPEVLGRVFDPFFTTKPRGTGLGLSIALRLIRENRGQITIRPRVGGGTIVSVELPAWSP